MFFHHGPRFVLHRRIAFKGMEVSIGCHKDPAFLQPPAILLTHHLFSTSFRAAKMSQYRFHDNLNTNFFNNWYSFDNTDSFGGVSSSVSLQTHIIPDGRSDILAWLSPLEPRLRHKDIQESRIEDVGEWVFETEEFRSWCAGGRRSESDDAVLFCYGDSGVGKTFLR